jgi:hypothetical protein
MQVSKQIDAYIQSLPEWQQKVCIAVRQWIHEADPGIREEIKFTNRPYFTLKGTICAILAAKDHVNIFIYDPIAPDPKGLINQGHENVTARAIQIYQNQTVDKAAFIELIQAVVENNQKGGWRQLKSAT